jgi:hypothetical protein
VIFRETLEVALRRDQVDPSDGSLCWCDIFKNIGEVIRECIMGKL